MEVGYAEASTHCGEWFLIGGLGSGSDQSFTRKRESLLNLFAMRLLLSKMCGKGRLPYCGEEFAVSIT